MTSDLTAPPASKKPARQLPRPPESHVSGFSWRDSTFLFYSLVKSVVKPEFTILDYGAGRGAQLEGGSHYKRSLLNFKGKVRRIVGVDVDDAVHENQMVDESHVIAPGDDLPFRDESFDLIFSDWVLEHVDDPAHFSAEVQRVLKPGGWFFARTPNRLGAIAIAAALVPNNLHKRVLSALQPGRKSIDVFPTRYRLNRKSSVNRYFPETRWENFTSYLNTELTYLQSRPLLFRIGEFLGGMAPSTLFPVLIVALRKRA